MAALCDITLQLPEDRETEPQFTGRVLRPLVCDALAPLSGLALQYRGDGTATLATPARFLGQDFFPDMAVSKGHQHLWAAEVKILKDPDLQGAIAKAIGQARIYTTRYEHSFVILVDDTSTLSISKLGMPVPKLLDGLRMVVYQKDGKSLNPYEISP